MPCVAEVVNRSLKADCTDFTLREDQPLRTVQLITHTVFYSVSKGLAKLANIACRTLLFVSVSLALDNQRTLLFGREQ